MRYPVTIDAVERVLKLLGKEWRGEWQREAAHACVTYPEVVIQGPRQIFGKTFIVSITGATSLLAGNTHAIGFPTLTQSTRILARETSFNVDKLGGYIPGGFKKVVDTITERMWRLKDNADYLPRLLALSTNEISRSKPEGYTVDTLAIDESHRSTPAMLAIFSPFLNVARLEGRDHIWYSGVGGHKSSLIEERKTHPNVKVIRYPASVIMEMAPEWKPIFETERASLSDWQWRQHYECLPATEGMRLMYPEVPGAIDMQQEIAKNIAPKIFFGIDVGKVVDSTVVKVISVVYGIRNNEMKKLVNELESFEITGTNYEDQALAVYNWINGRYFWRPENIVVELNGVGQAFYDILCKVFARRLRGIYTTAELKEQFWHETSAAIREQRFGVKNAEARAHYESLMYNVRVEDGKLEFEHSDHWMALCMAWIAMQTVEVL